MVRTGIVELWGLARGWWRCDRVRIAPRAGELYRLRPGAVVIIDHYAACVVDRSLVANAKEIQIEYRCETATGEGTLRVSVSPAGELLQIIWETEDRSRPLDHGEMEILE
jgi:hypothetical protein